MGRLLSNQFFHWVYITNNPKAMIKIAVTEAVFESVISYNPQWLTETQPECTGRVQVREDLEAEAEARGNDEILKPAAHARPRHRRDQVAGEGSQVVVNLKA